jgi:beta-lactamase regulating signal transducer with metallopeptidase domain
VDALVRLALTNTVVAVALAVLAVGLGRAVRRPALTHALWILVLLKLLTPAGVPLPLPGTVPEWAAPDAAPAPCIVADQRGPLPSGAEGPAPEAATEPPALAASSQLAGPADPEPAPAESLPRVEAASELPPSPVLTPPPPMSWRPWALILWLGGSTAWLAVAGRRVRRFRRLLRFAWAAPPALQDRARRVAARLGLGHCPGVWLLPAPVSPMLWALAGAPRLLLPASLWEGLSAEQQDALLAHELAHYRRGDHWVRRLELVATALYWWHPLLWWARHRLREAEEQCCDAWVVWALPGSARAYAAALLETVLFLSRAGPALPAGSSGAGPIRRLQRRLTMIVRGTTPRALSRAGFLAVLGLGLLTLPLAPSWAEDPPPEEPAAPVAAPPQQPPGSAPAPQLAPVLTPPSALPGPQAQPGAARPQVGNRGAGSGSALQDAEDEVALLRAQQEGKAAEAQEAEALVRKARQHLSRLEQLRRQGAVGEDEPAQARLEVEVQEARLLGRRAQLKEAQLRLQQAERRLAGLHRQGDTKRGRTLVGPATEPASTGGLALDLPRTTGAPDKGAPTIPGPGGPGGMRGAPGDAERRLQELERSVERLIRELRELRRQLGRPEGSEHNGARPKAPPSGDSLPKGFPGQPAIR